MDGLISKCYLTIEDREEIMSQPRQPQRNRMIIDILIARPYRTFKTFTKEVIDFDWSKRDIVSKLKDYETNGDKLLPLVKIIDISSHTLQLQKNFKLLVQNLANVESMVDHLISKDILHLEDQAEICALHCTREQSNRLLLTKLMYKDAAAYTCFLSVLEKDECYRELAIHIKNTKVKYEDKIMLQIADNRYPPTCFSAVTA
ncbi:Hypothetical predicted protein [Mytilus galloprovincialis]|uniref:CARD domain-containing protein n=1 Tax=Mytilus galloprovincialis TaxID=29158 RepID=A0A8B6EZT2_MYTGA|nr:Hypothetical predicted protein [Mytilus galloprovincialis]